MNSNDQPRKIAIPFASGGVKREIPDNSQIGITDGAASYVDGFPPKTMQPASLGGVPPAGADFNGIFNHITNVQKWQSAGGMFKFDAEFAAAVGGYPSGARLVSADGSTVWVNTAEGNSTDPEGATPAGWISSAVPDASATVKGLVELATNAETQAGADAARAVTPAGLVSLTATATRAGLVELATNAETQAGADAARAVTPAGLVSLTATEARAGLAAVATQGEADLGAADNKFITPLKLRGGFAVSFLPNGYIAFPSWLGGIIFQWGRNSVAASASLAVTLPLTFPNAFYVAVCQSNTATMTATSTPIFGIARTSLSQVTLQNGYSASPIDIGWFAIGK